MSVLLAEKKGMDGNRTARGSHQDSGIRVERRHGRKWASPATLMAPGLRGSAVSPVEDPMRGRRGHG